MTKYDLCINTGITAVPQVSWGMHICHFFESKKDLCDVIVNFVKAGLAGNEKCILVTSDPLGSNEAYKELNQMITGVDDYIDRGQLLIVDYNAWYTEQGRIDINAVLQRWIETERLALNNGYSGLRAIGIMSWVLLEDWDNIVHYESVVDPMIRKHRIVALCSYAIDNVGIDKVIDVVTNHNIVLIQSMDGLMAIGNSRWAKACIMKNKGLNYATIGNKLGVTRQRACQILNGQKKPKGIKHKMLTVSDAASQLGIHVNTVRHWSNLGILPTYRIGQRGDRRFKREDIDILVREGASNNNVK